MSGVRFSSAVYREFARQLLTNKAAETCGAAFAHYSSESDAWVVCEAELAPDSAYEERTPTSAILKPAYIVDAANRARAKRVSVVLVHTHPWSEGIPEFSEIDDRGETVLVEYFRRRAAGGKHLALVLGPDGCRSRYLGSFTEVPVWEVGERLSLKSEQKNSRDLKSEHDRQVRAFGEAGQAVLKTIKVGVIGAGGTGAVVIQQLAHLGVSSFTLIDPDSLDVTNLNRVVGARQNDISKPKVDIARDHIRQVNPIATVKTLQRDVVDSDVAPVLAGLDFLFLCTDSHASRAVVGQLAYQHLVPTIDMGVNVTVGPAGISHVFGRVQMLSPGLSCLVCTGLLDAEQVRREMLSPEHRAADPYIQGVHEPQPAVISINSTLASLAVTMFLGAVTPIPANARFQLYDGIRGTVRLATSRQSPNCIVCSPTGAVAKAGSWPLPTRPKAASG